MTQPSPQPAHQPDPPLDPGDGWGDSILVTPDDASQDDLVYLDQQPHHPDNPNVAVPGDDLGQTAPDGIVLDEGDAMVSWRVIGLFTDETCTYMHPRATLVDSPPVFQLETLRYHPNGDPVTDPNGTPVVETVYMLLTEANAVALSTVMKNVARAYRDLDAVNHPDQAQPFRLPLHKQAWVWLVDTFRHPTSDTLLITALVVFFLFVSFYTHVLA